MADIAQLTLRQPTPFRLVHLLGIDHEEEGQGKKKKVAAQTMGLPGLLSFPKEKVTNKSGQFVEMEVYTL